MSDNITVTPGTGATIAAENISGALLQRVKLSIGNLDVDDGDISATNPMPITGTVNLAVESIEIGKVDQGAAGSSAWKVDGSAVTQPVSGTFFQATQPVSGSVSISGTPNVAVTSLPSIPAGTNAIGSITNTSFIANAGTNLNTSGLAVESGGHLASMDTKILAAGQALMAESSPVVIASNQSSIPVTGTFYQTTQPVSGSVSISNLPSTQPVSIAAMPTTPVTGSFWQATQPVSVAAPVAVTGTFYQGTQPVSVATLPALATGSNAIGSITNTAFIANAGTNLNTSSLNLETTQSAISAKLPASLGQKSMAASLAVSLASDQSPLSVTTTATDATTNGSLTALNSTISILAAGTSSASFQVLGTWVGTIIAEASLDGGTTWTTESMIFDGWTIGISMSANNFGNIASVGYSNIRLRMSAYTSGTAIVYLRSTIACGIVAIAAPLPNGGNYIGSITNVNAITTALPTGANTIGAVNINGTVPISGSITATKPSVGTSGSAVPASSTLIAGSDGTNLRPLKASVSGVLSVDGSAVTQPISGTVTINNSPSVFDFSSTNLAAAATYSTPWFDSNTQGGGFSFSVFCDQPITYVVQDSPDNGTTTRVVDSGLIPASLNFVETHIAEARYFRVQYTNSGASATTSMFLSTVQREDPLPEAYRISDKTGQDLVLLAKGE